MSWTHHINGTLITPGNVRGNNIEEINDNWRKRVKYSGTIFLIDIQRNDYVFAKELESQPDVKHVYEIKENSEVRFTGEFTRNDMSFDDTKRTCNISVHPFDEYTLIDEMAEKEVNLLECPTHTISAELKSYLVFFYRQGFSGTLPDDFGLYWSSTSNVTGGLTNKYIYAQERIIVDKNRELTDWTLLDSGEQYNTYGRPFDSSIYTRPQNSSGNPFPFLDSNNQLNNDYDELLLGIGYGDSNYWEDEEWKTHDVLYAHSDEGIKVLRNGIAIRKTIYKEGKYCGLFTEYKNAILLKDAVKLFFEKFPVTKNKSLNTVVSTLLFKDTNCPNEPDFYTQYASRGLDYVGNLPRDTYYLIYKGDFTRPNASNPATKGLFTWKKMRDYLILKFNMSYHIDRSGNVRLEHLKYYETIDKGITLQNTSRVYSYAKDETPARQIFEENESFTEDFTKKEIRYDNIPVLNGEQENKQEYTLSGISTDIDGMNQRLDSISSVGWVLVEANENIPIVLGKVSNISRDTGLISREKIQNGNLSMANSLRIYYRHQCYRRQLYINDVLIDALSVKKQKKQTLQFVEEKEIDILKTIETDLGSGNFVSLKYPPVDGHLKTAEVVYD